MKANKFLSGLALVGMMVFISCGDDESGPGALTVESVTASGTNFETGAAETGIDLFGATSVVDAPLDLTVEVTFNKEVDASTVDASSITIGGLDGDNTVTVTTNGAVVTIATSEELVRGTDYTIEVAGSVTAVDGGALAGNVSTSFSTAGVAPVTPPQEASQQIYYDFNNNLEDEVGSYNPDFSTAITYGEDRFGQASSAAVFDGDVSIVEIPDADPLMETSDFTMSFWVRTNSEGHVDAGGNPAGNFVLGLGFFYGFQFEIPGSYEWFKMPLALERADGSIGTGGDLFFNANGETNANTGWQGTTFDLDLTGSGGLAPVIQDQWVHIVYVFNSQERTRSFYMNGNLAMQQDLDLWPEEAAERTVVGTKFNANESVENKLVFGFAHSRGGTLFDAEPWGNYDLPTSNHFKGSLDDFRIFHAAYSDEEVEALYNAEAP